MYKIYSYIYIKILNFSEVDIKIKILWFIAEEQRQTKNSDLLIFHILSDEEIKSIKKFVQSCLVRCVLY